jgi:hypothetical protein
MLSFSRIGHRELAGLCRRLSTALEAGIDARRVWAREAAGRSSSALRSRLERISAAIAAGSSVSDALETTGEYFPLLFREMVSVGEETGQEKGGFHLGAGDGHLIPERTKRALPLNGKREKSPTFPSDHPRPHSRERLGDPRGASAALAAHEWD